MISFKNLLDAFNLRKVDEVPQTFQIQEILKQRSSNISELRKLKEEISNMPEAKQTPTLNKRLNSLIDGSGAEGPRLDALPPVFNRTPTASEKEARLGES
jgi:hypothetical protein